MLPSVSRKRLEKDEGMVFMAGEIPLDDSLSKDAESTRRLHPQCMIGQLSVPHSNPNQQQWTKTCWLFSLSYCKNTTQHNQAPLLRSMSSFCVRVAATICNLNMSIAFTSLHEGQTFQQEALLSSCLRKRRKFQMGALCKEDGHYISHLSHWWMTWIRVPPLL